ncbi:hypothetical protein PCE1_002821 [Barthelona sp. PCE]
MSTPKKKFSFNKKTTDSEESKPKLKLKKQPLTKLKLGSKLKAKAPKQESEPEEGAKPKLQLKKKLSLKKPTATDEESAESKPKIKPKLQLKKKSDSDKPKLKKKLELKKTTKPSLKKNSSPKLGLKKAGAPKEETNPKEETGLQPVKRDFPKTPNVKLQSLRNKSQQIEVHEPTIDKSAVPKVVEKKALMMKFKKFSKSSLHDLLDDAVFFTETYQHYVMVCSGATPLKMVHGLGTQTDQISDIKFDLDFSDLDLTNFAFDDVDTMCMMTKTELLFIRIYFHTASASIIKRIPFSTDGVVSIAQHDLTALFVVCTGKELHLITSKGDVVGVLDIPPMETVSRVPNSGYFIGTNKTLQVLIGPILPANLELPISMVQCVDESEQLLTALKSVEQETFTLQKTLYGKIFALAHFGYGHSFSNEKLFYVSDNGIVYASSSLKAETVLDVSPVARIAITKNVEIKQAFSLPGSCVLLSEDSIFFIRYIAGQMLSAVCSLGEMTFDPEKINGFTYTLSSIRPQAVFLVDGKFHKYMLESTIEDTPIIMPSAVEFSTQGIDRFFTGISAAIEQVRSFSANVNGFQCAQLLARLEESVLQTLGTFAHALDERTRQLTAVSETHRINKPRFNDSIDVFSSRAEELCERHFVLKDKAEASSRRAEELNVRIRKLEAPQSQFVVVEDEEAMELIHKKQQNIEDRLALLSTTARATVESNVHNEVEQLKNEVETFAKELDKLKDSKSEKPKDVCE